MHWQDKEFFFRGKVVAGCQLHIFVRPEILERVSPYIVYLIPFFFITSTETGTILFFSADSNCQAPCGKSCESCRTSPYLSHGALPHSGNGTRTFQLLSPLQNYHLNRNIMFRYYIINFFNQSKEKAIRQGCHPAILRQILWSMERRSLSRRNHQCNPHRSAPQRNNIT